MGNTRRTPSTPVESTSRPASSSTTAPDHLHARGEHGAELPEQLHGIGPPPRPWRARNRAGDERPLTRTTSTPVESTSTRKGSPHVAAAPLRARGERG